MTPEGRKELKPSRLDAWIHWKKLELAKEPNEDDELFVKDIDQLKSSLQAAKEEIKAYRTVAASLYEWRFQRDPELQDKWDGVTKFGDEVDAEARRILKEDSPSLPLEDK